MMRRTIHTPCRQSRSEQWTGGAKEMDRVAGPSHVPGAYARRRSTRYLMRRGRNECTLMMHRWIPYATARWCRTGSLHQMAQVT